MANQIAYSLSPASGGEGWGERDPSPLTPHTSPTGCGDAYRLPPPASPSGATRARFPDGRLHFHHGPIDLVIGATGAPAAIEAGMEQAWTRFESVLSELVGELTLLRTPVQHSLGVRGPIAQRMVAACFPHRAQFITPMAAVAGAVADEIIEFFRAQAGVRSAYVNNGGDIALHLAHDDCYRVGLLADLGRVRPLEPWRLDGDFELRAESPVRGVATSGWRGRSFSLGIADSVTVLARSAAEADAAATMIANAVNVADPAIVRKPACDLKDDTDLGDRLVTVEVGALSHRQIDAALTAGEQLAQRLREEGTIAAAVLCLQGAAQVCGTGATLGARNDCWV